MLLNAIVLLFVLLERVLLRLLQLVVGVLLLLGCSVGVGKRMTARVRTCLRRHVLLQLALYLDCGHDTLLCDAALDLLHLVDDRRCVQRLVAASSETCVLESATWGSLRKS